MKKSFATVLICLTVMGSWSEAKAGLFDHDDKLPGEALGYKQPCPVRECTYFGTANGDLDLHMQKVHPCRYAAAMDVYNKGMFTAFVGIFKTFASATNGGFGGTASVIQEFYGSLCNAGVDGRKIADILSSDRYD